MERCEFYPTKTDDCICNCGSDVSGGFCTVEYSLDCQWANKERVQLLKTAFAAQGKRTESLEKALEQCRVELEKDQEKFKELYSKLTAQDKAIGEVVGKLTELSTRPFKGSTGQFINGIKQEVGEIAARLEAAVKKEEKP